MKRNSELAFVLSLHAALFALLSKPVDPSAAAGVTVVLGGVSAVLLGAGVGYEVLVDPPEDASA